MSLFSSSLNSSSRVSTTAMLCWPVYGDYTSTVVLHAAARLVNGSRPRDHVTSALSHWLQIAQRIEYKLCLFVHKFIVGQAPVYLKNLLAAVADVPSWSYEGELSRTEDSPQARREGVFSRCSTSVESSSNWPQNVAFYSCIQVLFENFFVPDGIQYFLGLYIPLLLLNCSGFIVFNVAVLSAGGALNQSL